MERSTGHGVDMMPCECENCADYLDVVRLSAKVADLEWTIHQIAQRLADENDEPLAKWL